MYRKNKCTHESVRQRGMYRHMSLESKYIMYACSLYAKNRSGNYIIVCHITVPSGKFLHQ